MDFIIIIFQIGKQDIMAHRVVLAAVSPYFAELFSSDHGSRKEVEGGGIIYEMEGGFSKEALETLVDYAYTSTYVWLYHIYMYIYLICVITARPSILPSFQINPALNLILI